MHANVIPGFAGGQSKCTPWCFLWFWSSPFLSQPPSRQSRTFARQLTRSSYTSYFSSIQFPGIKSAREWRRADASAAVTPPRKGKK